MKWMNAGIFLNSLKPESHRKWGLFFTCRTTIEHFGCLTSDSLTLLCGRWSRCSPGSSCTTRSSRAATTTEATSTRESPSTSTPLRTIREPSRTITAAACRSELLPLKWLLQPCGAGLWKPKTHDGHSVTVCPPSAAENKFCSVIFLLLVYF